MCRAPYTSSDAVFRPHLTDEEIDVQRDNVSQVIQNQDLNAGLLGFRTCGSSAMPPALLKMRPSSCCSSKRTHDDSGHKVIKGPRATVSLATRAAFARVSHHVPCWGGKMWVLSALSPTFVHLLVSFFCPPSLLCPLSLDLIPRTH